MRSLAFAAALFAATGALAQDIPGSDFATGFWAGAAQNDPSGQFQLCHVSIGYSGGETLWLSLYADDIVTVLLAKPGVTYKTGQSFATQLMTEVSLPTYGTGVAVDPAYVGMSLTGIDASIEFLTQGSYLRMLGVGIDQSFDIRGIGAALSLARACVQDRTSGNLVKAPAGAAAVPEMPKMPDLPKTLPKTGTGGTKPGLGTPAPKPAP